MIGPVMDDKAVFFASIEPPRRDQCLDQLAGIIRPVTSLGDCVI